MSKAAVVGVGIAAIAGAAALYYFSQRAAAECPEGYVLDEDGYCIPEYTPPIGCPEEPCPTGYECVPETGACKVIGTIIGTPRNVAVDSVNDPTKNTISWWYPCTVLQTISGSYTLIENKPGSVCKHTVGVTMYAVDTSGVEHKIFQDHPVCGRGPGVHPFTAAPGLQNIQYVRMAIDKQYICGLPLLCVGYTDNDIDIQSITGTAIVTI